MIQFWLWSVLLLVNPEQNQTEFSSSGLTELHAANGDLSTLVATSINEMEEEAGETLDLDLFTGPGNEAQPAALPTFSRSFSTGQRLPDVHTSWRCAWQKRACPIAGPPLA
ncbi:MAG: hypothetical protein E1N59_710 [Puniceicoccaceae bacterium 5H]|nr:MAG: hypothetical protein E1N59_710 [Puniceicoccaceae bacterium 5H]